MSDTILTGDWTVHYLTENRQKRIQYTGAGTTYTVNELYSALQDHFDESTQMDDGTPMSAQTPTAYTIGSIDAGDNDPWFIDHTSVEYLKGGALSTSNWTRTTGSNTGIVRVDYTEGGTTRLQTSDIGETITVGTSTGTILDYNATDLVIWIRPTDDTATHDFSSGGTMSVSNSSADDTVTAASNVTGDLLWANIYNTGLATLQENTHQYINQNNSLLTAYKGTSDWWGDGQFDILVQVREPGASAYSEIDYGKVRVLARQFTTGYAWFEVDLSAGGRNPIPLTSLSDLDNTTGYSSILLSGATGNFNVGDTISDDATNPHGVITQVDNPGATPTLHYYLVGDPLDDFANSETVTNLDDTGTGTVNGAPSSQGPALSTWFNNNAAPTITFGYAGAGYDLNEDGTDEDYSIVIDCNQATLAEVWEYLKYVTRRGNSADIDAGAQTVTGQFYTGIERRFEYTYTAGTFTEGDTVYFFEAGDSLVSFGTLYADDTAKDEFLIGDYKVVGTGTITKFDDNDTYAADGTYGTIQSESIITPVQKCPFGDFAGGTFFGAEGVVLQDYISTEANSFQLKDNQGTVVQVPTKISLTISNTRVGDKILVARTDVDYNIVRDRYSSHATNNTAGGTTFEVAAPGDVPIGNDEPGKSSGGVLRVNATDEFTEHRYRFASWDTNTFTLATTSATADAGGSATSLVDADGAFTTGPKAVVGDVVYNSTEGTFGYVTAVAATELTMTNVGSNAPVTDWSSDAYVINGLVQAYDNSDTAWVPLLDTIEDTGTTASPGTEGTNITYAPTTDEVKVVARNASGTYKMLPYTATSNVSNENFSNSIIRSPDSISSN